jgi:hypothetical protein
LAGRGQTLQLICDEKTGFIASTPANIFNLKIKMQNTFLIAVDATAK